MSESTRPASRATMAVGRGAAPEVRTGAVEERVAASEAAATTPETQVTAPQPLTADPEEQAGAAAEREAAPDGRTAVVETALPDAGTMRPATGPTRSAAEATRRAPGTERPAAEMARRAAVTTRRSVAEASGAVPPQGPEAGSVTPEAAVAALAADGPGLPFLIGVRHHAPSLAAAVPALLDAAAPDVLLVELPAEFQPWLGWLAHEETRAPVALAAVPAAEAGAGGERGPAFYPFADFSPELAALRWAARNGVPAVACDLPLADRAWARGGPGAPAPAPAPGAPAPAPGADSVRVPGEGHGLSTALRSRLTGREGDDLWDRLVEAPAPGSSPEALRRAALLTGWALRYEAEARYGVDGTDLVREACMRDHIAAALANGHRPAVVVGAFHTPALLPSALPGTGTALPAPGASDTSEAPAGATYAPADTPDAAAGAPTTPAREPGERAAGPTEAACTVSLIPYTYPCSTPAPATRRASGTRSGSTPSWTPPGTPPPCTRR